MADKPKAMARFITLTRLAVLLWACPSGPSAADCDYKIHRVKAEVVGIKSVPVTASYDVTMEFTGSSLGDNQHKLADLLEMTTDSAFMIANRISVGNRYFVDVSERTAGTCDSLYISFDHQFKAGNAE